MSVSKETAGCKSTKLHGLGYLAKPQTRIAQQAQLEQQARASLAAANDKKPNASS